MSYKNIKCTEKERNTKYKKKIYKEKLDFMVHKMRLKPINLKCAQV